MNAAMSLAEGPVPVMLRPWRPSESQETSDPGPPERCAGWFHGLVDYRQKFGGQGVQVELLA
jgi:hypothetical protein